MTPPPPPVPATEAHVAILMGVRNGARTLPEQLQSFVAQDHADWSLVVSDDGSRDGSREVIQTFAADHPGHAVTLLDGPRKGFAMNFISLLARLPGPPPFAALSDQDDIWLPGRLSRATALLGQVPGDVPALYLGRTIICDDRMRPLRASPRFDRAPAFGNALVQCIGGGNTMVLNRPMVELVQRVAPRLDGVFAHDWWLYQLATGAGGRVVYDAHPMVHYRQHGANLIGANDTPRAAVTRLRRLLRGEFRGWMDGNLAALEAAAEVMTDEARATLAAFAASRDGPFWSRLAGVRRARLHRQRPRETAALYVSALLRKL